MERIFQGQSIEKNGKVLQPYTWNGQLLYLPSHVFQFFGIQQDSTAVSLNRQQLVKVPYPDSFKLFGRQYTSKIGQYAYTLSGLVMLTATHLDNELCVQFVETAWSLAMPHMSSVHELTLKFNAYVQQNETNLRELNAKIDQLTKPVPIHIPSEQQYWIGKDGLYHVRTTITDVPGYWSPSQAADELRLRSRSRRPHVGLVTSIIKTALKIRNVNTKPDKNWQWFVVEFPNEYTGTTADSLQIRLTDEGMATVQEWWRRHAYEYRIEEKDGHGYYLDKRYNIYENDPLEKPFSEQVNLTVSNINGADIIDV